MAREPYEGTYIGEDGVRRRKGGVREPDFTNASDVKDPKPRSSAEDLNDERATPFLGKATEFETPKTHRLEAPEATEATSQSAANDRSLRDVSKKELEGEDLKLPDKPDEPSETASFPQHVGAGWYVLSDSTRVRGKADAQEQQRALDLEAKLGT